MDTSIYIPTNSVGGFPFAPHSCHCLLVIVLMIAILTGVRWYFIVVMIGIPYDQWCWASFHMHVGHPYFFFWKNSIQVSSQFFWLFVLCFSILSCMGCLYILDNNPLLVISLANILSSSVCCLYVLLMVFFAVWKLLSLIRFHLFILLLLFPLP